MTDKNANTEIRKEFCPNCEAETPCTHEAELYVCDICGEDFAKYIVSRNCNVSDVSMTRDVSTDIKTPSSIENTNPDYYKQELARRDEKIAEFEAMINPASFRKFLVEQIKDPKLAEAYVKACIQDTTYKELLARRDEIIARLKEDGERLCDIADMFGDDAVAVLKHRKLMEELE